MVAAPDVGRVARGDERRADLFYRIAVSFRRELHAHAVLEAALRVGDDARRVTEVRVDVRRREDRAEGDGLGGFLYQRAESRRTADETTRTLRFSLRLGIAAEIVDTLCNGRIGDAVLRLQAVHRGGVDTARQHVGRIIHIAASVEERRIPRCWIDGHASAGVVDRRKCLTARGEQFTDVRGADRLGEDRRMHALGVAAEDLVVPIMDHPIRIDRDSMTLGYAGVYSSFLLFAKRAEKKYGISAREILVELGRRGMVGGQEDMIEDTAITMARARSVA